VPATHRQTRLEHDCTTLAERARINRVAAGALLGAACAGLLPCPAAAQTVTLAAPHSMQFTDQQFGVTFRYPAAWSYGTTHPFYNPEAVLTPGNDENPGYTARAVVVAPRGAWPELDKTRSFTGADLVLNVFPGKELAACVQRLPLKYGYEEAGTKTIAGIPYAVVEGGSAGLCHHTDETIYVTEASDACYYFDLAIHTNCPPDGGSLPSPAGLRPVRAQLESILATVRIHPPQNQK
jgi:hypothetical protein